MHTEVALGVEVAIREESCLTPPRERLSLLVMEESHDTFLVVNVGFLAHIWAFHLVNGLLEELFVLPNKQFLDILKASFSLRDRVDLDALD